MRLKGRALGVHFTPLVGACIIATSVLGQEAQRATQYKRDLTVFAEAWGEGIFNSLNIEKTMTTPSPVSYHVRLGFGYWRMHKDPRSANFYAMPVDAAISYGRIVKIELSLGATPFWFSANEDDLVSSVIAPNFGLHLRVQQPDGGLFLRAGALAAPLAGLNDIPGNDDYLMKGTWGWNPGVAVGFTF